MSRNIKIIILVIMAVFWMFGIFKLSNMNTYNSNGKSIELISVFIEDALDITNEYGITSSYPTDQKLMRASKLINQPLRKVMHASVYLVLSFFICGALDIFFDHKRFLFTFLISIIMCFIFAITDEFHQTFVVGRTGQFLDVLIDTGGATVGAIFYSTYHLIYTRGYKRAIKDIAG